jgi:uncharacterized 2Fe-2S/4Fe-4S cluster protein (DUF4445 family)
MKISLVSGKEVLCESGTSIMEALKSEGIFLTSSCGGKGTCGKCKIIIRSGPYESRSKIKLSQDELSSGYVLACQTLPSGDLIVDIPKESLLTIEGKIDTGKIKGLLDLLHSSGADIDPLSGRIVLKLPPPSLDDNISDLERLKRELFNNGLGCLRVPYRFMSNLAQNIRKESWEITLTTMHSEDCYEITNIFPGDQRMPQYGIAVDIGTTTIVTYLIDLTDGSLVDVASIYNSQIRFGDDVITRIIHATEQNELEDLHSAVIADINEMISLLIANHGIPAESIDCFVAAGNTTMTHFFLNLDPSSIREEPYIPTANIFPLAHAGELNIKTKPNVPVYVFPCVASYVGGDIVAGVLSTRIHKREELSIFIDIGTNGEIVLGNSEWLMSVACSAGPCFEGSGIKHGMRATEGAIEDVRINPDTLDVTIQVIGDSVRPIGICGSGMIDAISDMFLTGILNQKGKLQKNVSERVREGEDGPEFVIHYEKDKDIILTEPDIENILRAKAAMYAGFSTLLKEAGFAFDAVHKVYIAGGFGQFLDIEKAIVLGLLPDMPTEKFEYMGNTSITGAYLCILSRMLRSEAENISKKMTYLELSVSRSFMEEYVSGLFIPHTNVEAFPTVKKLLKNNVNR